YLQTLPFSRLADRIISASRWGGNREESRGLGGLFGTLISGDK
ncbi:MAG TPA: TIGR00266 family protein, partial [Bacteroidia bacterium]|nr:TIGR00266 family protein [Bacteroidia bacterium]